MLPEISSNVISVNFRNYKPRHRWTPMRKLRLTRTVLAAGWMGTMFGAIWVHINH